MTKIYQKWICLIFGLSDYSRKNTERFILLLHIVRQQRHTQEDHTHRHPIQFAPPRYDQFKTTSRCDSLTDYVGVRLLRNRQRVGILSYSALRLHAESGVRTSGISLRTYLRSAFLSLRFVRLLEWANPTDHVVSIVSYELHISAFL